MSYSTYYTNGWADNEEGGTPITAAALNHMEKGIAANDTAVNGDISCTSVTSSGNIAAGSDSGTSTRRVTATNSAGSVSLYVNASGDAGLLNGTTSAAILYQNSASNTYLGTSTTATYIRGSTIYAGGIRVPQIQHGVVTITPSAEDTPTGVEISFDTAFSGTPTVVVTPRTGSPGTVITGASCLSPSSTGVTIYVTRTNTVDTPVCWVAVY